MADEKTVLIKIELDTKNLKVNAQAAQDAITKLRLEEIRLDKQFSQGKVSAQEYNLGLQKNKEQIKLLTKEYNDNVKALAINDNLKKKNTGSIIDQRNELKILTNQYNQLSKEERESVDVGQKLQKAIREKSDALLASESALGNNTRNVGNYKSALTDLKTELKEARGELLHIASTLGEGSPEYAKAAQRAGELNDRIDDVNKTIKASSGEGIEALKGQFSLLGDKMKDLDFKGISAQLNSLNGTVKGLKFETLTEGIQGAGKAFLSFSKTLLLNPFVLTAAAIAGLIIVLKNYMDSVDADAKATKEFSDSLNSIKDDTRALNNELDKLIADNKVRRGELSKSDAEIREEKKRFSEESIKLEEERTNKLKEINENEALFEESKLKEREEVNKIFDEKFNVIAKISSQKRIDISRNEADEKLKSETDFHRQLIQLQTDNITNEITQNKTKLQNDAQFAIEDINNSKISEEKKAQLIIEINKKLAKDLSDVLEPVSKATLAALKFDATALINPDDVQGNMDIVTKVVTDSATSLQQSLAKIRTDGQIQETGSFIQTQDAINELRKTDFQKQLDDLAEQKVQFLLNHQTTEEQREQITKEFADRENKIKQAQVQSNLSLAQDAIGQLQQLAEGNTAAQKSLALFQVGLDTAKAVSALTANSEANPANAVTFGTAGILQFATGILRIFANIAQAKNIITATPKAEHGIILGGQPHSGGGTMISADGVPIAEAEKGELLTIVNKRSTGMLQGLSNLNQLGGGIPFMERGGVPEFQSGGIAITNDRFSQRNNIANLFKNMPRPVVVVQDIIEATGKLTDVEHRASV